MLTQTAACFGVIDHGGGQSHLSLFTYNVFGELSPHGAPITINVPDANGVAIMVPIDASRRTSSKRI